MAAVSAPSSSPTPVFAPALPSRVAQRKPAAPQSSLEIRQVPHTVRRTEMPALCAERREPPTAMTRQPGRVRLSSTWPPRTATSRTSVLNGAPTTEPLPMKSQRSESGMAAEIARRSCP
jgi:hypothetical protein